MYVYTYMYISRSDLLCSLSFLTNMCVCTYI